MKLSRIKELQIESEHERLSMGELVEIQDAFELIPDEQLSDERENATASDMLDELERLALTEDEEDDEDRSDEWKEANR
jgi:hypothetical protein